MTLQSIVKVKRKFNVTIPKRLRNKLPLKVGQLIEMDLEGDRIILKPFSQDPCARLDELMGKIAPKDITRQAERVIVREAKSTLAKKLRRRL